MLLPSVVQVKRYRSTTVDGTEYPISSPSGTFTGRSSTDPIFGATQSPTTRGTDLFIILVELEGTCQGCTATKKQFDQMVSERELQTMAISDYQRSFFVDNGCFCPVRAENRGRDDVANTPREWLIFSPGGSPCSSSPAFPFFFFFFFFFSSGSHPLSSPVAVVSTHRPHYSTSVVTSRL
jgi:hypothetical protein